ncbi:uncharacterized protein RAG0_06645 [Rhynchosporium agropyri]|uniref:Clr5 domain-containing protein n=1 Tax=Rhynchosporium agropyri TaxID=914238 RepID=A0A1E1KI07_9HELO|nr:uncharacterized protein RAG0_06645 [Rhynchosporium agropyri]
MSRRALGPELLPRQDAVVKTSETAREASCRLRNDKRWNFHKDEIRRIYIEEDRTLQVTMRIIEEKYGFKASPRKWKMKLKEWNFEKYFPATIMSFAVAKTEKRKVDEGKDTVFFHGDSLIPSEKIEHFKRRKMSSKARKASPDPGTPRDIRYHTPDPERSPSPIPEDPADYRSISGNQRSVIPLIERSVTPILEHSVTPRPAYSIPQMMEGEFSRMQPPPLKSEPEIQEMEEEQDGQEDEGEITAPPSYEDELPALSPLMPLSSPNSSSNLHDLSQNPQATSQEYVSLPKMEYLTINPVFLDVNHVGDESNSSNGDHMAYQADMHDTGNSPDAHKREKEVLEAASGSLVHGVFIDFPRIASRLSGFEIAGQSSYLQGSDDMLPNQDNTDEESIEGTMASVEQKIRVAKLYRESGSLKNAESAYLQALVEYSEVPSVDGKIAQHIPEFLLFFKLVNHTSPLHSLDQSVFICRWLLVICEKELSQGPETLRITHALADLLRQSGRPNDAEDLYAKSFAGFKDLGLIKERLECQRSLGTLLFGVGRLDKAMHMLVSTLCEYMTDDSLEDLGHGDEIGGVLTALSDAFTRVKHDRHWDDMKASVSQLQVLLIRPSAVCRWSQNIQPKVFLEAMRLASHISEQDWYDTAEMLYLVTVPKIHALDNFIYGRKKADAFIAYCMQHQRRKQWRKCIRDILHAYKCLMAGDRESAVQEGPVDLLRETWSVIKKAAAEEPNITKDSSTRESIRKIDHADQKLLCWKKLQLSGLLDESEEEDWEKDTTRSSKYGVTYSVSDVTGVSYSAYYRELH